MKPVLGSLGANTLVILTAAETQEIRAALMVAAGSVCAMTKAQRAFSDGILRGTAHLQAEFDALQKAKKQGK